MNQNNSFSNFLTVLIFSLPCKGNNFFKSRIFSFCNYHSCLKYLYLYYKKQFLNVLASVFLKVNSLSFVSTKEFRYNVSCFFFSQTDQVFGYKTLFFSIDTTIGYAFFASEGQQPACYTHTTLVMPLLKCIFLYMERFNDIPLLYVHVHVKCQIAAQFLSVTRKTKRKLVGRFNLYCYSTNIYC